MASSPDTSDRSATATNSVASADTNRGSSAARSARTYTTVRAIASHTIGVLGKDSGLAGAGIAEHHTDPSPRGEDFERAFAFHERAGPRCEQSGNASAAARRALRATRERRVRRPECPVRHRDRTWPTPDVRPARRGVPRPCRPPAVAASISCCQRTSRWGCASAAARRRGSSRAIAPSRNRTAAHSSSARWSRSSMASTCRTAHDSWRTSASTGPRTNPSAVSDLLDGEP